MKRPVETCNQLADGPNVPQPTSPPGPGRPAKARLAHCRSPWLPVLIPVQVVNRASSLAVPGVPVVLKGTPGKTCAKPSFHCCQPTPAATRKPLNSLAYRKATSQKWSSPQAAWKLKPSKVGETYLTRFRRDPSPTSEVSPTCGSTVVKLTPNGKGRAAPAPVEPTTSSPLFPSRLSLARRNRPPPQFRTSRPAQTAAFDKLISAMPSVAWLVRPSHTRPSLLFSNHQAL